MLSAWRRRLARRRAEREEAESARAAEVLARTEAVVKQVMTAPVRDGLARIERVEEGEIFGPEIRVIPNRADAAGMTINPMSRWVALSVEYGNLEIFVEGRQWEDELAMCMRSVVAGAYWEVGESTRMGPSVKSIFGQPDGDDLTYTSGGLYKGAAMDYPPGERRYASYS